MPSLLWSVVPLRICGTTDIEAKGQETLSAIRINPWKSGAQARHRCTKDTRVCAVEVFLTNLLDDPFAAVSESSVRDDIQSISCLQRDSDR